MPVLALPKVTHPDFGFPKKKPVGFVRLEERVNCGLCFIFNKHVLTDYANRKTYPLVPGVTFKPPLGFQSSNPANPLSIDTRVFSDFTLSVRLSTNDSTTYGCIPLSSGTNHYLWLRRGNDEIRLRCSGSNFTFTDASTLTDSFFTEQHTYTFVRSGTNCDLYIDGVFHSSASGGSGDFQIDDMFDWAANPNYNMDGIIEYLYVFNEVLSAGKVRRLHNAPYHILKPVDDLYLFTPESGGADYTLTAEQGTYTLTGGDAGLTVNRKLSAEQGSYTLTGGDATLTRGYTLTAEQGTYTLTGGDVTFTYNSSSDYTLVAEAGSYTLTGGDVSFTRSYRLDAEQGLYNLSGGNATLTYSGEEVETASGGIIDARDYQFLNPPTRQKIEEVKTVQEVAKKQVERETKKEKPAPKKHQHSELRRALKKKQIEFTKEHEKQLEAARDQAINNAIQQQLILENIIRDKTQKLLQEEQEDMQIMLMMLSSL